MTATVNDWRGHAVGDVQPCRICGSAALLRDADGIPCHKTCAEKISEPKPRENSTMELRPHPTEALLRNATCLAEHGWPVFLLGRTKRPLASCAACRDADRSHNPDTCKCLTCHGFYAATTDRQQLAAMCDAYPRGLLAVRTGAPSGLVVIDVDPNHGGAIDPTLMPPTTCVATGSGGWHLYYRHPGTPVLNSQSRLAEGVDVRGDGGYVVAPPSIHPVTGQPYRWVGNRAVNEMPPPLLAACQPPPPAPVSVPTGPTSTRRAGGISSPHALLNAHLDAIRNAPVGKRRGALYGAARGVARMVAADAIDQADALDVLTAAGRAAEQTDREIRAAIAGGFQAEGVAA